MTNDRFKFRAWNKKNHEMINDVSSKDHFKPIMQTVNKGTIYEERIIIGAEEDDDIILMQYVGLKDKNGKLIYEGDIVKKSFGSFTIDLNTGLKSGDKVGIFQIKFNELHCSFGLFKSSGYIDGLLATEYNDKGKRHRDWRSDDIEIIGNIYENPELLNND